MKVVHISRFYHGFSVGGTELFQREILENSSANGVVCDLIVLQNGMKGVRQLEDGAYSVFGIYRDPQCEEMPYLEFNEGQTEKDFAEYLMQCGMPDVVCFHSWGQAEAAIAKLMKEKGIPYALIYHTPAWSCIKGDLLPPVEKSGVLCDGGISPWRCGWCYLNMKRPVAKVVYLFLSPILSFFARFPKLASGKFRGILTVWRRLKNRKDCLRQFIRGASSLISFSPAGDSVYLANGGDKARLHRLAQGVGTAFEVALRNFLEKEGKPPCRPSGRLKIGILGRCCGAKGVHILVQAFTLDKSFDAELHVVGVIPDTPYARRLSKMAGGDERIHFHEPVPFERTMKCYTQIDILAIPSIGYDTGPITLFEGLATGCFVMGSMMLGQIDTLKKHGRVVDPNTPDVWLEALKEESKLVMSRRRARRYDIVVRNFKTVTRELNSILAKCNG